MNKVEYLDHMGSDLTFVNAARVSMGKSKDSFDESDEKLIKYLIKHKHTSPFRHATVSLRIKCPIIVERQLFKHQVGVATNSVSGRYVYFKEEFWIPEVLRKGSASIKQGSLNEPVDNHDAALSAYINSCKCSFSVYESLLDAGVAKEQARAVLPLSTYTEFVMTASFQALWHLYGLRSDSHAQAETRWFAFEIEKILEPLFPVTWRILKEVGGL